MRKIFCQAALFAAAVMWAQTATADDEFTSYVLTLKAEIEGVLQSKYEGGVVNWQSLECVAFDNRSGSCVIHGDLSAPNSSTNFAITIARPNFADCDYETYKIHIKAIYGEC